MSRELTSGMLYLADRLSRPAMTREAAIKALSRRILAISFANHLSHIGSCLTVLPILYDIYVTKKPEDRVILSAGHGGLALYVVLEHFGLLPDAETTLLRDGIHPTRNAAEHIDCSTGSLGQGITVGVGMALARPDRQVYVVSTDGEMAEGSWWESVYFACNRWPNARKPNLQIRVNANGWTALSQSWSFAVTHHAQPFNAFGTLLNVIDTTTFVPQHLPWFQGLEQHYHVMTEPEYREIDAYYTHLS